MNMSDDALEKSILLVSKQMVGCGVTASLFTEALINFTKNIGQPANHALAGDGAPPAAKLV